VGPFGFGDRAFDSHMIDLSVVVSSLPLVGEIYVGTSGDGEDCAMGEKVVVLLYRFVDLQQMWWRWVGLWLFIVDLCCLALGR
jgi:hypothetical protein